MCRGYRRRRCPADPRTSPSPEHKTPAAHVADGCEWTEGRLDDNAPKEARLAQGIAKRVLILIRRHNTTPHAVARRQRLGIETLYSLIKGRSWPNLITVARPEIHFNRRLWGHEHLSGHPQLKAPRDYTAEGEEWPEGTLAADAPKEARLAHGIANTALRHIHHCSTTPDAVAIPANQEIGLLSNVEMSWSTFGGPAADIYAAIIRARCDTDGIPQTPDALADQFRLHLHRGITYLVGTDDTKALNGMIALALKT